MSLASILPAIATLFNLVALAVSLGLGLYIVTRSRISWLAALTLWCLALFFFRNALAINASGNPLLPWLQPTLLLLPALWFHLNVELRLSQERMQQRRSPAERQRLWGVGALRPQTRTAIWRLAILAVYAASVGLLLISLLWFRDQATPVTSAAMHSAARAGDPLYPFATAYVLVVAGLALANLWQGYRRDNSEVRRRQFRQLFIATVLAALGSLYVTVGIVLGVDLPELPRDVMYGVAATISVLMLYDGARSTLDRFFYRDQFRQLRANLRSLASEAGTGLSLPEQLDAVLAWLRSTLSIEHGLIALAGAGRESGFVVLASQGPVRVGQAIPASRLLGAEITALASHSRRADNGDTAQDVLAGMALLAPITVDGSQIGALLLGPKSTGQPYADEDLMLLDDVVDQLAAVIRTARLQEENAHAINAMVSEFRERERAMQRQVQEMLAANSAAPQPGPAGLSQQQFGSQVEDALRRLHDYPALGEHPLAGLAVISQNLATAGPDGANTHIDRGKALKGSWFKLSTSCGPTAPRQPRTPFPRASGTSSLSCTTPTCATSRTGTS